MFVYLRLCVHVCVRVCVCVSEREREREREREAANDVSRAWRKKVIHAPQVVCMCVSLSLCLCVCVCVCACVFVCVCTRLPVISEELRGRQSLASSIFVCERERKAERRSVGQGLHSSIQVLLCAGVCERERERQREMGCE